MGLTCCLLTIQAQDTTHLSLDKLLQEVDSNYPSILQYQYNKESLQNQADGAKAWMPPTFSAGLMRWPYSLSGPNEKNDPMRQAGVAFSIEQMIPNTGKLNAKQSYISSLVDVEESKKQWTTNELRREAKVLYYNRYVAEKKQDVLKESDQLLKLFLTAAEEKFSNNQSQLQTIYKARARLAELNNMKLMLDAIIAESNIGLNTLMVRDVGMPFRIDTLVALHNYSVTNAERGNVSNRSDVTALSNAIQSMRLEQRVMKIGVRPDFGVRVEHMQMVGMPNQWSVMGMVTIPIAPWSSKMYSAETRSIGSQIQSLEKEVQTKELMATRSISEKLTMLSFQNAQYQNYNETVISAYENNLQATLLAYRQNTGDFFELLDAWETLLMKKLEAHDRLLNILKLEAEYEYEKEIR